ncbi:MAG TPA: pilus assembly protein TadG-related protein [Gemmatimonadaceae bacterium]|nr:pilus assembly protein TadG-related protein [Gemmatimonadaceae bacterium]
MLVSICMVAVLGVLVIALDGGIIQREKRKAQAAADAAAQAGAIEIFRTRPDLAKSSAISEAARNGFTNGVGLDSIGVWYPNTAIGTHTGTSFVGVLIQDTVSTVFGRFLGFRKVVVTARAVGGVTGTAQNCVTILDPTGRDALKITSGATVMMQGCKVAVNSNNSEAMYIANSSLTADGITITGGWNGKSYTIDANGSASGTPAPTTGAPRAADPLASSVNIAVAADTAGCPGVSNSRAAISLTLNEYKKIIPNDGETLNPGIYCGGIKVGSDNSVYLNPGLYVIKGNGIEVSGGGHLTGNGPLNIVNLNGIGANAASNFEGFNFASDAVVTLTASTTKPGLSGILFFSPPGMGNPVEENSVNSSGVSILTGSLYFPDQLLHVGSGNGPSSTLKISGGIVAKAVEFLADSKVTITGFSGGGGGGVPRASVVE